MRSLKLKSQKMAMLLACFLLLTYIAGCGGNGLVSGGLVTDYLSPGETHTWEFQASAGSTIYLSVGSTMQTYLTVYNPDGTVLANAYNAYLKHDVEQSGVYKVLVQTRYQGGEGNYVLHYANSLDAKENGVLTSGAMHSESLTSNDIDSFTLSVNEGDSVMIFIDSDQQTLIYLFNPDGSLLTTSYNILQVDDLEFSGEYRIFVVGRYALSEDNYDLHYVNGSTAEELGFLTSGGVVSETLTSNDLDTFQFSALAGDSIYLSINASQQSYIRVFNPDGSVLTQGYNSLYYQELDQDGDYRVVVRGRYAFTEDAYELHYVNSRTALELGFLQSGAMHNESLTANDLDTFQFAAIAGDTVHISIGSSQQTYLRVFDPSGGYVASGYNGLLIQDLAIGGDYRVVVQSRYAFTSDDYELHFVNVRTAAEHGSLPAQGSVAEMITANDLDSYSVEIDAGEDIALSATGDISVRIYLYQNDGALVATGRDGIQVTDITDGGTYRVVVVAFYQFQTGAYTLTSNIAQ